jgi:hypothetical protein
VDLVVGRDLDQLDRALAPIALRLDPEARPALIEHAVEIMADLAVALQQAESRADSRP